MKRFRFPLRPVAVLRSHQELRAREVFAAAVHAYADAEAALARTRVHLRALEAALFSGRGHRFPAAEAAVLLADYRRECAAEATAEQGVITARADMDKRRAEYLEAHRRLEIVNRLEQKARTLHRREADREEQAEFDDRAGRRPLQPSLLTS
jgi:flagellar FliJ protein